MNGFQRTGFAGMAVLALCCSDRAGAADDGSSGSFSAGVEFHENVAPKEVGLPLFPGAVLERKPDDDSPSVALSFGLGGYGLKVVALKYRSNDRLAAIIDFYRDALGAYGPVLDCSHPAEDAERSKRRKDHGLACEDEHVEPGSFLFKAGTKYSQHIVEVNGREGDVHFNLVRVELRGAD